MFSISGYANFMLSEVRVLNQFYVEILLEFWTSEFICYDF